MARRWASSPAPDSPCSWLDTRMYPTAFTHGAYTKGPFCARPGSGPSSAPGSEVATTASRSRISLRGAVNSPFAIASRSRDANAAVSLEASLVGPIDPPWALLSGSAGRARERRGPTIVPSVPGGPRAANHPVGEPPWDPHLLRGFRKKRPGLARSSTGEAAETGLPRVAPDVCRPQASLREGQPSVTGDQPVSASLYDSMQCQDERRARMGAYPDGWGPESRHRPETPRRSWNGRGESALGRPL